jgi:quercetin dioxygenase-like cupin family protein
MHTETIKRTDRIARVVRRCAVVAAMAATHAAALSAQNMERAAGRVHDPDSLTWRAMGPLMEQAIVDGNPAATGEFALAIRFKAGGVIQPHWHPNETRVTVIRGDVWVGFGDQADTAHTKTIAAGGFAVVPAEVHHYEGARTDALIIITGAGPLKTTMVNAGPPHP